MDAVIRRTFGRYTIEELIREDAFQRVYRARWDQHLDPFALTLLDAHLGGDAGFADRFDAFGKSVSRLSHSSIVPLVDWGMEAGRPFLASPFVPARTLKHSRPPLGIAEAAGIAVRLGEALETCHRAGIVHAALNLQSIAMSPAGVPLIPNPGLVRFLLADGRMAHLGGGPVLFRSPEEANGDAPTALSDVYSLGTLLYWLLTGRPPYEAATAYALLAKRASNDPVLPSAIRPEIPKALEAQVLTAMARDPERRFRSAAGFAAALSSLQIGVAPATRHIPAPEPKELSAAPLFSEISPEETRRPVWKKVPSLPRAGIAMTGGSLLVLSLAAVAGAGQGGGRPETSVLFTETRAQVQQAPDSSPSRSDGMEQSKLPPAPPPKTVTISNPLTITMPFAPAAPLSTTQITTGTRIVNFGPTVTRTGTSGAELMAAFDDLMVVVNRQKGMPEGYAPADLAQIDGFVRSVGGPARMRRVVIDPLRRMIDAMKANGLDPAVVTTYRSYGDEQAVFQKWVAKLGQAEAEKMVPRPGFSEYQLGTAIDFASPSQNNELNAGFGETAEGKWLAANASRYGFIRSYPAGKENVTGYPAQPWHYRYVGDLAFYLEQRNLTLEEYAAGRR